MNFMKVAGRDVSNIFKNRFIRVSVVAIIIVPLLYSLLYLAAFWDPYSKLQYLPVAVVNLDTGAVQDGKEVSFGKDVADNLKKNSVMGWRFVTLQDAQEGVKGSKYYGMFVIPEDFSKNALSAKDGKPQKPTILFQENEKKNFLAAQINGKVTLELQKEIAKSISDEYVKVTFDSLYEVKDGMAQAADGSSQLKDGIAQLNGQVPGMKDGVKQLYDGSADLTNGLGQAKNGAVALYGGADSLNSGIGDAKTGAVQLNQGLAQIDAQAPALTRGISDLYNGSGELYNGVKGAADGAGNLNSGIKQYTDNAVTPVTSGIGNLDTALNSQILPGIKQAADGSALVQGCVNELIKSMTDSQTALKSVVDNQLMAYISNHREALQDPNMLNFINSLSQLQAAAGSTENQQKIEALQKGAKNLNDGLNQVYSGVNGDFKTGLDTLNASVPTVKKGATDLYSGSTSLSAGLNDAVKGSEKLNEGLKQLNGSVPALTGGVDQLYDGSGSLVNGLNQLYSGSGEMKNSIAKPEEVKGLKADTSNTGKTLFSGITELSTGSTQLKDGLGNLNGKMPELEDGTAKLLKGSAELSTKLKDGSDKVTGSLKNSSSDMAEFISDPLIINSQPINPVKDYGTGFTPYFIPLSLWVGALMMFFVITDKVDEDIKAGPASVVLGKFLSYG
ncbi:MAG: YhgE/Pip domain-containing protein, partial [Bacillota bacterium]|nr:YhgE/Pip domain-containing protein [Bacillota bacterium]